MSTIAYDKPVADFVARLSATGHVTHKAYRKTSVTLHHNGGRLSHQGVLNVWKSRPASAHFDVDASGAVAQYVKVNEYAWATGNTSGNQTSISVEMANATVAPRWVVSDTTWKSAARLAGWLFAKVIGVRPSSSNFFYHHHWSSTACAGPYMDKIPGSVLAEAQRAYDTFKASPRVPPVVHPPKGGAPVFPLPSGWYFGPKAGPQNCVSGYFGHKADLARWQQQMRNRGWSITVDGLFGNGTASVVRKFQAEKRLNVSGLINPQTWAAAWTAPR